MNGAQWVIKILEKKGTDIVFGYPGGAIMPLYDALYGSKIKHLLFRHEQGAILASIGYARSKKKIGICIATSGPGTTNLITGLADALLDSIPIIAITGQVDTSLMGTDAFQEIDTLGLSLSCTKHSFLVRSFHSLPKIFSQAFFVASKGRPGPVLIDIPKNIQLQHGRLDIKEKKIKRSIFKITRNIKSAHKLIKKSKKPILYIGGGVHSANAISTLRTFISTSGIPSVVTLQGIGSPEYTDSCYLGLIGMHGNKAANLAVQMCDLLIAIGTRFDDRATGNLKFFASNAKTIHIDIDFSEFNKLRKVDVILLGNLKYYLSNFTYPLFIQKWRKKIRFLKKKYKWNYVYKSQKIHAPYFLKTMGDNLPQNSVVTTDVGQHQMWTAQHVQINYPQKFITSGGLGTMGFGIPAAIGAQIAKPKNTVICVSGDGSFMMNVQELTTIKRKKLPIKIILLDNQKLGMVKQWQKIFYQKRYSETILDDNPDFLTLVSSFSISGKKITRSSEISNAIQTLLNFRGAFLLHVILDASVNVWPLVPPGFSNDKMLEEI